MIDPNIILSPLHQDTEEIRVLRILKKYETKSESFKLILELCSNKHIKYYNNVAIFIIMMNTLIGVLTFSSSKDIEDGMTMQPKWMNVALGSLNGLLALASSLSKLKNWEKTSTRNHNLSVSFGNLASNIRLHLTLDNENRKDSVTFLSETVVSYNKLYEDFPNIPKSIYKIYFVHARERGLSVPDLVTATLSSEKDFLEQSMRKDNPQFRSSDCISHKLTNLTTINCTN